MLSDGIARSNPCRLFGSLNSKSHAFRPKLVEGPNPKLSVHAQGEVLSDSLVVALNEKLKGAAEEQAPAPFMHFSRSVTAGNPESGVRAQPARHQAL